MFGLSTAAVWFFIILFVLILGTYARFMIKTMKFLLKGRPLAYENKWKNRFPIMYHAEAVAGVKPSSFVLTVIGVLSVGVGYVKVGGNLWFAVLTVTVLFATVMLMKEFSLHYYCTENELIVWSVHEKPYSMKNGKRMYYTKHVRVKDVIRAEEVPSGFLMHISEKDYVYIKANVKQKKWLLTWLNEQNTQRK